MRFSIVSAALFAGANALVASDIVKRELATVTTVFGDVRTGFNNLQKAAADFKGEPAPLKKEAAALIARVEAGNDAVAAMAPLTVSECLSLVKPSNELTKQGQALADELKSRLADVEKAKECGTVRGFLDQGVADANALIVTLTGKVPASVQSIVKQQGNKITNTLKDAQAAFAKGKCVDGA